MHAGLSEEEKMKICYALNYEKLSTEACIHLSQNAKFASKSTVQALISQPLKIKNLLQGTNNTKLHMDSPCNFTETRHKAKKDEASEQIVLYSGRLDISADNDKLRAHLQGMQWRVMELEKICKKMQTQMAKILKSKVTSHSTARSLPRLCSWKKFYIIFVSLNYFLVYVYHWGMIFFPLFFFILIIVFLSFLHILRWLKVFPFDREWDLGLYSYRYRELLCFFMNSVSSILYILVCARLVSKVESFSTVAFTLRQIVMQAGKC